MFKLILKVARNSVHDYMKILISCHQISISCFLIDVDLISTIFKSLLNGSSWLFGPRLFDTFPNYHFPKFRDFQNDPGFSWIVLIILVSPELKIIVFGSHFWKKRKPIWWNLPNIFGILHMFWWSLKSK